MLWKWDNSFHNDYFTSRPPISFFFQNSLLFDILFLDLPNLTTFIIDPSNNIHLSLLRFVNVRKLGCIQRAAGQEMTNLDFPALVNFLYNKDGISAQMYEQARAPRVIQNQHPDPEFYENLTYEGHVCHQIQVFDRESLEGTARNYNETIEVGREHQVIN